MHFSLKRFGSLTRLFFQQNWKSIAVYFAIYTMVLFLMGSFIWAVANENMGANMNQGQTNIFFLLMDFFIFVMSFFGLFILLQYIFKRRFHNTNVTIGYLQIPTTTTEKWLFDILIIGVGFTVTSLLLMYGTQQLVFNNLFSEEVTDLEIRGIFKNLPFLKIMTLFTLISISTICTDYLKNDSKKWNWKSIGMLIAFVLFPLNSVLDWFFFKSNPVTGDTWTRIPFQGVTLPNPFEKYENFSIEHVWTLDDMFLYIGLPTLLMLWAIHYFKLKEYEV